MTARPTPSISLVMIDSCLARCVSAPCAACPSSGWRRDRSVSSAAQDGSRRRPLPQAGASRRLRRTLACGPGRPGWRLRHRRQRRSPRAAAPRRPASPGSAPPGRTARCRRRQRPGFAHGRSSSPGHPCRPTANRVVLVHSSYLAGTRTYCRSLRRSNVARGIPVQAGTTVVRIRSLPGGSVATGGVPCHGAARVRSSWAPRRPPVDGRERASCRASTRSSAEARSRRFQPPTHRRQSGNGDRAHGRRSLRASSGLPHRAATPRPLGDDHGRGNEEQQSLVAPAPALFVHGRPPTFRSRGWSRTLARDDDHSRREL